VLCPADSPRKSFSVEALEAPLPIVSHLGKVFVLTEDRDAVVSGERVAEPLVLHVNVGDCIIIELTNGTAHGAVSMHADMLAYDPRDSAGVDVGRNSAVGQAVLPGDSRTFTFYAHPEVGETTAMLRDWGDVLRNPSDGLYGAIVVGPRGATITDPATGADIALKSSWRADVSPPGAASYRDFTLLVQDQDEVIGTAQMPYSEQVQGAVGINYRAEPLAPRLARNSDTASVFSSAVHGDPSTPLLEAFAGDAVQIHVLAPASEQAHVFSIEGHRWPFEAGRQGTPLVSSTQLGALDALTLRLVAGSGPIGNGSGSMPGDYLYGDHREPYRQAGLWGIFRVYPPGAAQPTLVPLP
jgi:hypothetical protein